METPEKKVIPEGMVEIADGTIIDRADMCTKYSQHPNNPKLFYDRAGICYIKGSHGGFRRFPPKMSREERKAQKKLRREKNG